MFPETKWSAKIDPSINMSVENKHSLQTTNLRMLVTFRTKNIQNQMIEKPLSRGIEGTLGKP